jgi:plastocyanin
MTINRTPPPCVPRPIACRGAVTAAAPAHRQADAPRHPYARWERLRRLAGRGATKVASVALAISIVTASTTVLAAPLAVRVTDPAGRPLQDAVVAVYLRGAHTSAAAGTTAQLAQHHRQFEPRLLVVQTGTAVHFPNLDTVRHHVYSFSAIRKFELKLYSGTPAAPVIFDRPGTATLGCNIHDQMSAWVLVVDTPLFARTDANGRVTLEVPAGDHLVQGWHASQGETAVPVLQALRMPATATTLEVKLDGADAAQRP